MTVIPPRLPKLGDEELERFLSKIRCRQISRDHCNFAKFVLEESKIDESCTHS